MQKDPVLAPILCLPACFLTYCTKMVHKWLFFTHHTDKRDFSETNVWLSPTQCLNSVINRGDPGEGQRWGPTSRSAPPTCWCCPTSTPTPVASPSHKKPPTLARSPSAPFHSRSHSPSTVAQSVTRPPSEGQAALCSHAGLLCEAASLSEAASWSDTATKHPLPLCRRRGR